MAAGVGDGEQPLAAVDQPESAPALMQGHAAGLGQFSERSDIDDRPVGARFPTGKAEPFRHAEQLQGSDCERYGPQPLQETAARQGRRGWGEPFHQLRFTALIAS